MTTSPLLTAHRAVTATAEETAALRDVLRRDLPPAGTDRPSPVHAFVLAHTLADQTVRALAGDEPRPLSVIHLSQTIRLRRPVRPGEKGTATLDVRGARREARGTRVAVHTRLAGEDGDPYADLLTGALLVGATTVEPFGELPPPGALPPGGAAGEPVVAVHRTSAEWTRRYAHASGDLNPIHLDDDAARAAGFPSVIAHGMSVLALACEEIADRFAAGDIGRVAAVGGRFSAPVPTGEELSVEMQPYDDGSVVRFGCRTPAGPSVKSGWVELAPAGRDGAHG